MFDKIKNEKIGCLKELEKEIGYSNLTRLITLNYISTKRNFVNGNHIWYITDNFMKLTIKEKIKIFFKRIYFENLRNF